MSSGLMGTPMVTRTRKRRRPRSEIPYAEPVRITRADGTKDIEPALTYRERVQVTEQLRRNKKKARRTT